MPAFQIAQPRRRDQAGRVGAGRGRSGRRRSRGRRWSCSRSAAAASARCSIGDLWRWNLRRDDHKESDLEKAWRQTVRWLVADVPQPVEVETRRAGGTALPGVEIRRPGPRQAVRAARQRRRDAARSRRPTSARSSWSPKAATQAAGRIEATFAPRAAGRVPGDGQRHRRRRQRRRRARDRLGGRAARPRSFARSRSIARCSSSIASETGGEVLDARRPRVVRRQPAQPQDSRSSRAGRIRCGTSGTCFWSRSPAWSANGACAAGRGCHESIEHCCAFAAVSALACAWLRLRALPLSRAPAVHRRRRRRRRRGIRRAVPPVGRRAGRRRRSRRSAEFAAIGLDEAGREVRPRAAARAAGERWRQPSTEAVWLVLIGHGTFDGKTAKFNLRGADVTPAELAAWLKPIERPLAIIDCTSSSGPFLERAVGAESRRRSPPPAAALNSTSPASATISRRRSPIPTADLDKDEQTSLLEAFLLRRRRRGGVLRQRRRGWPPSMRCSTTTATGSARRPTGSRACGPPRPPRTAPRSTALRAGAVRAGPEPARGAASGRRPRPPRRARARAGRPPADRRRSCPRRNIWRRSSRCSSSWRSSTRAPRSLRQRAGGYGVQAGSAVGNAEAS